MGSACYRSENSDPAICGEHKVPLVASKELIDRDYPYLGIMTCLKCPVSGRIVLDKLGFREQAPAANAVPKRLPSNRIINVIRSTSEDPNSKIGELQRRTIESLEAVLDRIAILPSVISKLAALDLDSEDAAEKIIELVSSDPTLALRLLDLANVRTLSSGGVDTIPKAIALIGTKPFAGMVLALSVVKVFVPRTRGQCNLWIHSIQTSLTARRLATLRPELGIDPEAAFLAGLLHDIGRFVIFEYRPEENDQLENEHVADPSTLIEAERRICGFDHAALGGEICYRWHLPVSICDMVRVHHCYGESKSRIPSDVASLVQIVQQADAVSFVLLENPALAALSYDERRNSIEASLLAWPESERILSAEHLADEIIDIDHETRAAASLINILYPK